MKFTLLKKNFHKKIKLLGNLSYLKQMKTINKAYKVRLYPTQKQTVLLDKHFGCNRLVYNHFLNLRNKEYKENKLNLSYIQTAKQLTILKKQPGYEFLSETDINSMQWSLKFLDSAFSKFFRKTSKFPRFKSKRNDQFYTTPYNATFKIRGNKLIIPRFLTGIKFRGNIDLQNITKFCLITVSKDTIGRFFASISCEVNYEPKSKIDSSIGIDLGLKDFAIDNDGVRYQNPKFLKRGLKKIKYLQRQVSKKKKDSNNKNKQRIILARQHKKITNRRNDFLHKLSTKLINENQVICLETLSVKKMMQNHQLAQAISDVSWSTFVNMLKYKGSWNDRQVVQIDKFYPSSKSCSNCHYVVQELPLSIREWQCPQCYTTHDRDVNAAKNILIQGLNILSGVETISDVKQKHKEASSLEESKNCETISQ